jgi:S1-C subfamily serine protease
MTNTMFQIASILFGVCAFASAAFSQTAMHVARKAFPSVVMIVMEDANRQPNAIGSGFFVAEGVVASNFHVVEGAAGGFVKIIGDKTKYDIEGIVGLDEFHDLVLLQVKAASAAPLALGDSKKLAIGEEVFAVGNPQGLEGTFSQGIISSIRELEGGSLVQITAPISPGSSGGPVMNGKAEVVGVTVATYKGGQNLNFAIPAQYLKDLLAKKGSPKPIKASSKRTSQDSVLKDLGGKSTEGVVTKRFEWPSPICFKFSVVNQLRQPIRSPRFLVIFYDNDHEPLDFKFVTVNGVIPAGLAQWTSLEMVDESTGKICYAGEENVVFKRNPKPGTWEIRVLGFELLEE